MNIRGQNIAFYFFILVLVFLSGPDLNAQTRTTVSDTLQPEDSAVVARNVHVGVAMALTVALPGLGETYLKGHGANWLIGIGGYGLIAGSLILNGAAYENLERYRESLDPYERDEFYDRAQRQAAISYVCAGGALVIWVAELITTGIKAGKIKKSREKMKISSGINEQTRIPVVGIIINI